MARAMGFFVTFEGGEGVGKSTQVRRLAQRLRESGREVVPVYEPGGTRLGEEVRRWVRGVDLSRETELLLFTAARAELVAKTIRPSLERGAVVIADRFADSTVAYQGYARGIDLDVVRAVNAAATGGLTPDLTLLLDLPEEEGLARAGVTDDTRKTARLARKRRASPGFQRESRQKATPSQGQLGFSMAAADPLLEPGREEEQGSRFEQESLAFHRRVRSGFLKLAKESPERILVIDAAKDADAVGEAVWGAVSARLG